MKKGIEFYNMLTNSEKKKFRDNVKREKGDLKYMKQRLEPDMWSFIYGAFRHLPEDYDYWDDLIKKYDL